MQLATAAVAVRVQVAQALSTRVDILDANYLQQIELLQVRHCLACVRRCCVKPGCLPCVVYSALGCSPPAVLRALHRYMHLQAEHS